MSRISKLSNATANGEMTFKRKPPGRPSKMTTPVISEVHDLTVEDPDLGSKKLAKQIVEDLGITVSAQIINSI
jgi:hypothetical protein